MTFNQNKKEVNKDELRKNAFIIPIMVVLGVVIGVGLVLCLSIGNYYGKKNLKQAEECFAEERYEDALSYYEKAFHQDYSLADAWLGAAECHIIMGEYEEAFDILEEGDEKLYKNWNWGGSRESRYLLFEKQKEIFQRAIDAYLAEDNYQDAYVFVNQWLKEWKATGMRKKLLDVKTQVYLAEADSCIQGDDNAEALRIIDEGIKNIPSLAHFSDESDPCIEKLQQKKLEAEYLLWSEQHLPKEDYVSVKQKLMEGSISISEMADIKTQVYLAEADRYLQEDFATGASRIIDEGIKDISSSALFSDESDLCIEKLQQKKLEAEYMYWLKNHLSEEDYVSARQVLMDDSISVWAEKEAYLQEKVGYVRVSTIKSKNSGSRTFFEYNDRVQEYNEKGMLTKEIRYDTKGNMTGWDEYEYNEAEDTIKNTRYKEDGSIRSWVEYENNKMGKPTRYVSYKADGSVRSFGEYEYDEAGNGIIFTSYQSDEGILNIVEHKYDAEGKLTQYIEYIVECKYEHDYLETGLQNKERESNKNISVWITYDYDYLDVGPKPSKERYHDSEGNETWRWENTYDKAENLISQEAKDAQGGSLGNAKYYEYDILGNIIKFTEIEGDEKTTETYNYDYIYIGE